MTMIDHEELQALRAIAEAKVLSLTGQAAIVLSSAYSEIDARRIRDALSRIGIPHGLLVIFASSMDDVQLLDENKMRAAGWVRHREDADVSESAL